MNQDKKPRSRMHYESYCQRLYHTLLSTTLVHDPEDKLLYATPDPS